MSSVTSEQVSSAGSSVLDEKPLQLPKLSARGEVKQKLQLHYEYLRQEKVEKEESEKALKEKKQLAQSSMGTLQEFKKYLSSWQQQFEELNTSLDAQVYNMDDGLVSSSAAIPAYFTFQTRTLAERWQGIVSDFIKNADALARPVFLEPGHSCTSPDGILLFVVSLTTDKQALLKLSEQFRSAVGPIENAVIVAVTRGPMTKDAQKQANQLLRSLSIKVRSGVNRSNPVDFAPHHLFLHVYERPNRTWELKTTSETNMRSQKSLGTLIQSVTRPPAFEADKESNEEFLRKYLSDLDISELGVQL